jgi:putative DNA primase/helicase
MIDFQTINTHLLPGFRSLVTQWIPGGTFQGAEYCPLNPRRSDKTPGSFKINVQTGSWSDFAAGAQGGDPISLYAYLHDISNGKAASDLSRSLGLTQDKPKGKRVYLDLLCPCPADAPPVPEEIPVHTDSGWIRYPVKMRWAYRNQTGQLLGYVVRYETPAGKETPPLTLWRTADHGICWRTKGWPDPRPLFHLDKLAHAPEAQVIVVEGEKCAEVLQGIIEAAGAAARLVVVTWPGGAKAIKRIDFTPLRGRRCVLWPDFDLQAYPDNHMSSGQIMPFHEQPGVVAMVTVAGILRGLDSAAPIKIVQQQPGYPAGWDVADAIADGWDFRRVVDFIREHAIAPDIIRPVKTKATPLAPAATTSPDLPAAPDLGPKLPFKPLGYRGDYCYYLPVATRQVRTIKTSCHGSGELISLAPLSYWERTFSGPQGPNWKMAADTYIRLCERAGVFDPLRQRGRGGWYDEGRSILHLGDRLIVGGQSTALDEVKSRFIYEAGPPLEYNETAPLAIRDAHRLRDILDMLFWERPIYATFLAGWIVIAPICGALPHRPHVWLTGGAGTGKTHVIENIIKPILGNFSLPVQSETTSAGIRQALEFDALPVLIDEFEGENFAGQERVQKIIELARQAFSDSSARIIKGSQGGKPTSYHIRSCFLMSSIGVNITKQADASRIMILSLVRPYDTDTQTKAEHFKTLCALTESTITDQWASGFRARSIAMIPTIRKNTQIFAAAVAECIGNRRAGDQIGPLLAGAWSLSSDAIIDPDKAREWVNKNDWSEQTISEQDSDERRCLDYLLQHIVRLPHEELSVAEMIFKYKRSIEENATSLDVPVSEYCDEALKRIGIKYDHDEAILYISDSHTAIKKILERTSWSKGWARLLKRLPGANCSGTTRFLGTVSRTTGIPLDCVFNGITQ